MKISYDQVEDILMIETTANTPIDHAEQSGPLITHLSKEGQLVLLEILDASEFLSSLIQVSLRGQPKELTTA